MMDPGAVEFSLVSDTFQIDPAATFAALASARAPRLRDDARAVGLRRRRAHLGWGSRHIDHSGGLVAAANSATTANPCRSYSTLERREVASR